MRVFELQQRYDWATESCMTCNSLSQLFRSNFFFQVMIAHQNVIAQCLQVQQITPPDLTKILAVLPAFHSDYAFQRLPMLFANFSLVTGLVHSLHRR